GTWNSTAATPPSSASISWLLSKRGNTGCTSTKVIYSNLWCTAAKRESRMQTQGAGLSSITSSHSWRANIGLLHYPNVHSNPAVADFDGDYAAAPARRATRSQIRLPDLR